ncbi:hypothetical protein ABZX40_19430 [Streptomyces sp. NPDC004610]|uniref:hypothetical protein n=1 Tax=unclassified Streptomyces TaxID=2593676 RepID=UPI0033BA44A2
MDGQTDVVVEQDVCAPLAEALSGDIIAKPTSTEIREASGESVTVTLLLAQYGDGKASPALDTLATSTNTCADGFTATVDGKPHHFTQITPELAPEGADQAMALGAQVERDGTKTPVKVVVLRKGDTVAYLSAVPDGRTPDGFAVPPALIGAQLAKLAQ